MAESAPFTDVETEAWAGVWDPYPTTPASSYFSFFNLCAALHVDPGRVAGMWSLHDERVSS